MKKRFFKKLKKCILILSCFLSCLVICAFPATALTANGHVFSGHRGNMWIPGYDVVYSDALNTSDSIYFHFNNPATSEVTCHFTLYFAIDEPLTGTLELTLQCKGISGGTPINNTSYNGIYLFDGSNYKMASSSVIDGSKFFYSYSGYLGTSIMIRGIFRVPSGETILSCDLTNFSFEGLYNAPSTGSTSELEGVESELVGSTNSAAQEEINKSFNISFDLIQQWAYPISAFRDAFNYFVNSHNAVYTICIITLVIGVFLLFSNFVPRGRDK